MNMSVTEQQKAYHLRKLRTRCHRFDMNHDGYLSREDFELVAKRLVENASGITKEKTEEIHAAFLSIADLIGLKPGVKIPLDEAAKSAVTAICPQLARNRLHIMTCCLIASIQTAMDTYPSRNSRSTSKLWGTI